MSNKLVVVLGPTAVGKTKLAVKLARYFNGEIISADSRQVYQGMDIGTGKDLDEYRIDGVQIPFHLIDIISPQEEFNLFSFQEKFYESIRKIYKHGKVPFLVGGTGLYIHSILKKYSLNKVDFNSERFDELNNFSTDELQKILKTKTTNFHNTTDFINRDRIIKAIIIAESEEVVKDEKPELDFLVIGVGEAREIIKERITKRLKERLKNGMIEEVRSLIESGVNFEKLELFGLEYRYIAQYIKGDLSYNDMFQKLNSAIHKFAKRQMTWFRKMEKEGIKINWVRFDEIDIAKKIISDFLGDDGR